MLLRGLQEGLQGIFQDFQREGSGRDARRPHGSVSPANNWGAPKRGRAGLAGASVLAAPPPFEQAWEEYCARNPRLRDPKALPALVRHGVPQELRAKVWMHCLGIGAQSNSPSTMSGTGKLIDQQFPGADNLSVVELAAALPAGVADVIDADVMRTFPSHDLFQQSGGAERLRRILLTHAANDAEMGYCQSLNFLASMFIIVFPDDAAVLEGIGRLFVKLGIRSWYTDGMRQLRADTVVLEELLEERLPVVCKALRDLKFDLLFATSKWFLCLFATTLEGESLNQVWDIIVCDGIEAVFRVAFALLAQRQETILAAPTLDDLIIEFQQAPVEQRPGELVHMAYDPSLLGPLHRADLSRRRQQSAQRVSVCDTRAEMRNTHLWRGGVRPASVLARST